MKEKCPYSLLFKQLSIAFENNLQREAAQYGLTAAQAMHSDLFIQCGHRINQRELESYYHLSNPTVTGLMKRMESKGFIRREVSREDGRAKYIILTEKAMEISSEVQQNLAKMEQKVVQGMTLEESEQFHALLVPGFEKYLCMPREASKIKITKKLLYEKFFHTAAFLAPIS